MILHLFYIRLRISRKKIRTSHVTCHIPASWLFSFTYTSCCCFGTSVYSRLSRTSRTNNFVGIKQTLLIHTAQPIHSCPNCKPSAGIDSYSLRVSSFGAQWPLKDFLYLYEKRIHVTQPTYGPSSYVMLCCCLLLTNDNDESGMSVVVCVCCQTVKHLNVFPSVIMHRCKRYVSTILQLAVSIVLRIGYLMGDIKFATLHPQTNFF